MNQYPLDITFITPGMPHDGKTLESDKSLGGSETASLCMARELQKLGHRVTVFCNCTEPGQHYGVIYRPMAGWDQYVTLNPHDVTIVQRIPEAFRLKLASKMSVLWVHDLAQGRRAAEFCGTLWNVDKVATVSKYHTEQYKDTYGCPDHLFLTSRNGIDLQRFDDIGPQGRNRKALIWAARPERGLDVMLHGIFPKLLAIDPQIKLWICGYDNTVPQMAEFYDSLKAKAKEFGDAVEWLGALNKRDLYTRYKQAGIYAYPTPGARAPEFREVSCISVMEAMGAGLPIVTTNIGALPETMAKGAGVLVEPGENVGDEDYQDRFVQAVQRLINDDKAWEECHRIGKAAAKRRDWSGIAKDWSDEFHRMIDERNASKESRAIHFIKHSDIMAAKETLKAPETPRQKDLYAKLHEHWGPLLRGDDEIRTQYETIGAGHSDCFAATLAEPRLQALIKWVKEHTEIKRILDVGCAHGSYAIHLANETGIEVVGVDLDKNSIAMAKKWRDDPERCKNPERLKFYTVAEFEAKWFDDQKESLYDAAIFFEVLEHVPDPTALVDAYEPYVKPGGKCVYTVPYGPWEYISYETYPHRCHLWEFDLHDLKDLFGKKTDFQLITMAHMIYQELAEPLGWHWIEYTADDIPTGKIDMARKQAVQVPKPTVSACIIAGPDAHANLHWCLESLHHVADEIIIGDCGMTDEGRRIAKQYDSYLYNIKFVDAPDPKEHGFETPRNAVLEHATGDFILWIDTDEKLLGRKALHKYLRANCYDGYSIKQWHFACDTSFNPDLPVRLFRRVGHSGKAPRWFGMIHEHPETELNKGPGMVIGLADVHIPHVGYLNEEIRRERFGRNLPLLHKDKDKYPDRILQQHFWMRDFVQLSGYELQQNGGRMTPEIMGRLDDVIDRWRKNFRGKNTMLSTDSIKYMSQACELKHQATGNFGFVTAWGFKADKQAINGNMEPPKQVRFATMDDMTIELKARMEEAVRPLIKAHY